MSSSPSSLIAPSPTPAHAHASRVAAPLHVATHSRHTSSQVVTHSRRSPQPRDPSHFEFAAQARRSPSYHHTSSSPSSPMALLQLTSPHASHMSSPSHTAPSQSHIHTPSHPHELSRTTLEHHHTRPHTGPLENSHTLFHRVSHAASSQTPADSHTRTLTDSHIITSQSLMSLDSLQTSTRSTLAYSYGVSHATLTDSRV
jgi:hypothetical protein